MNQTSVYQEESLTSIGNLTKIGLITSLYIVVTLFLSAFSFGPIQVRLSEMFNYLAIFHKRYIVAVFLGVVIANALWSPMKFIDVPVGGLATLFVLIIVRVVTQRMKNKKAKFVVTALLVVLSMFTVAAQLYIVGDYPFWWTYLTVAIGELLSMTVGGFLIYYLSKRIDFTK